MKMKVVKMSEQVVKRYDPEAIETRGSSRVMAVMTEDAQGDWVSGEDYDALHAEAEALRAENGRKQQTIDEYVIAHHKEFQRCEKMRTELEAARGLLQRFAHGRASFEDAESASAFLAATPAPEVRHALSAENQRVVPPEPIIAPPHPLAALAEQGERHTPRRRASGEYECSCGAVWDADEGSDCPNE